MEYSYLSDAILGTSAGGLLAIALFHLCAQIRQTPIELLQLRIFQNLHVLQRALLCLGIGLVGGVFLLLPILLQISIPQVVYLALGIPFFGLFVDGLVTLIRAFRLPAAVQAGARDSGHNLRH